MMTTERIHESESDNEHDTPESATPAIIDTRKLFGDLKEICLEHDGERYRLRITRKGRLILSK
jgi:hemin uptake protein HemP